MLKAAYCDEIKFHVIPSLFLRHFLVSGYLAEK